MTCAISVFDILKIGIGPSSSHTLGPWKASLAFLEEIQDPSIANRINSIEAHLYGSLALTGIGHGTDIAIMLGLSGESPETMPLFKVQSIPEHIHNNHQLNLGNRKIIPFTYEQNIRFHFNEALPFHPNGLKFTALDDSKNPILESYYYSIGGGFITKGEVDNLERPESNEVPFHFSSSEELIQICEQQNISIAELAYANELAWRPEHEIKEGLDKIWQIMAESIHRGCHTEGLLPGGLNVVRRAAKINQKLLDQAQINDPESWVNTIKNKPYSFSEILKWVSCFAMAVNEENASFGRIVTAPTNGAAGVIPAVLKYMQCFVKTDVSQKEIHEFLLTASVVGSLFKHKATISAAMGGCQAEIGVSSSMAAAALTAALGGSMQQALIAAEIAMEHHLGMTCDPIKGLVQVPCIERNSMGAVKAITATNLALETDPTHTKVSLDDVIHTMWETAQDMNLKYKETSQGGLATNVSLPEC